MLKIISVALNHVYDLVISSNDFSCNSKNLISKEHISPAEKGANVVYYLSHMGKTVAITGFLGTLNYESFINFFIKNNILNHTIPIDGRIRTNIKVESKNSNVTDIDTIGSMNTKSHIEKFNVSTIAEKTILV